MTNAAIDTDVLIVGAGPVGLGARVLATVSGTSFAAECAGVGILPCY
jgi:thioredoxin reductase